MVLLFYYYKFYGIKFPDNKCRGNPCVVAQGKGNHRGIAQGKGNHRGGCVQPKISNISITV